MARVPGMGRCGTGPQPGRQIWDLRGGAGEGGTGIAAPAPRPACGPRTLTWLRWATRTSRSLCTRRCPAWSVAPQLPLSPPPAAAPPCTPPTRSSLGPLGPTPRTPAALAPVEGLRLAPPSQVTGQRVTRGVHQLVGRRDPGGREGGGRAGNRAAFREPLAKAVLCLPMQTPKPGVRESPACPCPPQIP